MLRDVLHAALAAAIRADRTALAAMMAPDIAYWDALHGTVSGAQEAAATLAKLFDSVGNEVATSTISVRTGDDIAAVAEVDTARTRLAVVAFVDASGTRIGELRSYVDPAELRH